MPVWRVAYLGRRKAAPLQQEYATSLLTFARCWTTARPFASRSPYPYPWSSGEEPCRVATRRLAFKAMVLESAGPCLFCSRRCAEGRADLFSSSPQPRDPLLHYPENSCYRGSTAERHLHSFADQIPYDKVSKSRQVGAA